jgi:putative spermidine/putrescine transport system substrate-binding protein
MASKRIGGIGSGLSRRAMLKGAALGAGAAIGSGAVTGFPVIWAQNVKDITLIHIGGSYACIKEIADQAGKDLGFKVEMQVVDPATQLNRALTQPKSFDINNIDNSSMAYLVGKGVLKPVSSRMAGQSRSRGFRRSRPGSGPVRTPRSSPTSRPIS